MDDLLRESLARIIAANQKARGETSKRTSRLLDSLVTGEGDFSDAFDELLDKEELKEEEKEGEARDPRDPRG